MKINNKFFKFGLGLLLILAIIFMLRQVSFVFVPLKLLAQTLITPFLIAGILYYLMLPIYNFLLKRNFNKTAAIITMYGSLMAVLAGVIYYIVPLVVKQLKRLIENMPSLIKDGQETFNVVAKSDVLQKLNLSENIDFNAAAAPLLDFSNKALNYVGNNVINVVGFVTDFALLIIVIPFLLFYLFKENDKISDLLVNKFKEKHRVEIKKILSEVNDKLSFYIQGQLMVSFIVGILLFIGYLIIGLDYALVLAIIAMVSNIIPFLGPIIGMVFAIAVALTQSLKMALFVVVVVLVVQAVDSNYISPKVLGDKLDIHPLTIIFVLLFAGNLNGIVAMLVAVPAYSILKVLIQNGYRIYKLSKNEKIKKKNPFVE